MIGKTELKTEGNGKGLFVLFVSFCVILSMSWFCPCHYFVLLLSLFILCPLSVAVLSFS